MLGNCIANSIAAELQRRRLDMMPRRARSAMVPVAETMAGLEQWKQRCAEEDMAQELDRYSTEREMG